MKHRVKKMMMVVLLTGVGLLVVTMAACMRVSNRTWYFSSAPVPEGWPELTPIGEVEVKEYPVYRAATVSDVEMESDGMKPMFMTLFNHIKRNEISMTAPVAMAYDGNDNTSMTSMAFLYRKPEIGSLGNDGAVRVEDLASRVYASVGVRGGYTTGNYQEGLKALEAWLSDNTRWQVTGPARYLGYNSPFVPTFARYGEVQLPVAEAVVSSGG